MFKQFILKAVRTFGFELSPLNKFWFKGVLSANTSYELDHSFHDLYEDALQKTGMAELENPLRRNRHYSLLKILKNADLSNGDIAECGCWKGMSTFQIATYLKNENFKFQLHVFDSFEGLSKLDADDRVQNKKIDEETLRKQFACGLESVQNNLKDFNFIQYHKGWIPDKFHEVKDSSFSFVHIDVDLYQPIKDSIDFFYPRLTKNGIMVFDDYGCTQFPGAKKAIDEFVERNKNVFFVPMPSGEAFLLKKD